MLSGFGVLERERTAGRLNAGVCRQVVGSHKCPHLRQMKERSSCALYSAAPTLFILLRRFRLIKCNPIQTDGIAARAPKKFGSSPSANEPRIEFASIRLPKTTNPHQTLLTRGFGSAIRRGWRRIAKLLMLACPVPMSRAIGTACVRFDLQFGQLKSGMLAPPWCFDAGIILDDWTSACGGLH